MAKKVLNALSVFFLLIVFTGCENTSQPLTVATDFSADFIAIYSNMEIKGSLNTNRQGILSICITSPDSLSGLEVEYINAGTSIKLDGLECSADEAYIPSSGFTQIVRSILKKTAENNQPLDESREVLIQIPQGSCKITTDENGIINTAVIDDIGFKIQMINAVTKNS